MLSRLHPTASGVSAPQKTTPHRGHFWMPIDTVDDNYSAHKHKAVLDWLKEHRRWTFHFTPTSCSWMNAVEGFFGKLARRRLRRGVYDSIEDLERSIQDFIDLQNEKEAKPFKWTARPERLIAARQRGIKRLRPSTSNDRVVLRCSTVTSIEGVISMYPRSWFGKGYWRLR